MAERERVGSCRGRSSLACSQNGDGKVSPEEFEAGLYPKTRAKIEERLNMGWKFDHTKWAAEAHTAIPSPQPSVPSTH